LGKSLEKIETAAAEFETLRKEILAEVKEYIPEEKVNDFFQRFTQLVEEKFQTKKSAPAQGTIPWPEDLADELPKMKDQQTWKDFLKLSITPKDHTGTATAPTTIEDFLNSSASVQKKQMIIDYWTSRMFTAPKDTTQTQRCLIPVTKISKALELMKD
jgi:hypothetical protein